MKIAEQAEIKNELMDMVQRLPDVNFALLRRLCNFLNNVSQNEAKNKMGIKNLATVFGPILLRYPDNDDVMMIIRDSPRVTTISSVFIYHASELFAAKVCFFPFFLPSHNLIHQFFPSFYRLLEEKYCLPLDLPEELEFPLLILREALPVIPPDLFQSRDLRYFILILLCPIPSSSPPPLLLLLPSR